MLAHRSPGSTGRRQVGLRRLGSQGVESLGQGLAALQQLVVLRYNHGLHKSGRHLMGLGCLGGAARLAAHQRDCQARQGGQRQAAATGTSG
jgi:hypothetical protein